MERNFVVLFILLIILAPGMEGRGDEKDVMTIEVGDICLDEAITVKVLGTRDKPLKSVNIDVYDYKDKKVAYGRTDSDGVFEFTLNKVGVYEMELEKSGYKIEKVELNVLICATTTTSTTSTTTTTSTILTTTTRYVVVSTTARIQPTTTIQVCNRNAVCEPERGENYITCPSDCHVGDKGDYCGDKICSRLENYGNCGRDCPSGGKDNYCDGVNDKICDPDCSPEQDPDCKKTDYTPVIPLILLVLLVFGIFIFYGMKRQMKDRGTEGEKDNLIEGLKKRLREGEDPEVLKKELIADGLDPELLDKAEQGLWSSG